MRTIFPVKRSLNDLRCSIDSSVLLHALELIAKQSVRGLGMPIVHQGPPAAKVLQFAVHGYSADEAPMSSKTTGSYMSSMLEERRG